MIVLDASILIAHLDANDGHHERATALLRGAADEALGGESDHAGRGAGRTRTPGEVDRGMALLHELDVTSVRLVDDAPGHLAVLRARTGLKLPDCCVLLAAEQTGGAVATFADRLANAATERGLAIRTS